VQSDGYFAKYFLLLWVAALVGLLTFKNCHVLNYVVIACSFILLPRVLIVFAMCLPCSSFLSFLSTLLVRSCKYHACPILQIPWLCSIRLPQWNLFASLTHSLLLCSAQLIYSLVALGIKKLCLPNVPWWYVFLLHSITMLLCQFLPH
jgi:hypothetical protein